VRALVFDGKLTFRDDYPLPRRNRGEALLRVKIAGICNTDIEILRGYMDFSGVPGHEFVAVVEDADRPELTGKRAVGEINIGCGVCDYCRMGLKNHCKDRSVLGIYQKDGAFAEYLTLPVENLHILPDSITDEEAVFVEPLAAAFEVLEQINIGPAHRVCVLGDGKLGLLVAQVIHSTGCTLKVVGRHEHKLSILRDQGIETSIASDFSEKGFDVVVDCTGTDSGMSTALDIVRPRGTVVLKTTIAHRSQVDMNRIVIDEITLVGSRCGPFLRAIEAIRTGMVRLTPLISARYSIDEGIKAMEHASERGVLKVLMYMSH